MYPFYRTNPVKGVFVCNDELSCVNLFLRGTLYEKTGEGETVEEKAVEEKAVVEEKLITGAEYKLPYFAFGKGEKNFILIPGASMTSILGSEDGIRNLFAPYTEEYRIYVFDVPEDLDSITGIEQIADILADAADALEIEEADVYGASMGGMIAQKLAIRHPNLVRSLSLASSMSRNNKLSEEVISGWAAASDPEELARLVNTHVYSEAYYSTYEEIFHSLEKAADADGVARLHNLTRIIQEFSSYDELDKIQCPVYVYAGSSDNTLGVEASTEIAGKLGCFIKVYDGYSHAVYDECPGFYDEVFDHLK